MNSSRAVTPVPMMTDAQLPIGECQFRDGVAVVHPDMLKELQAEGLQWSPEFLAKMGK
jgi:hypothetical protein